MREKDVYLKMLQDNFDDVKDVNVILDIAFPILFMFTANDNKVYLAYVTKMNRRKHILDVLFFETSYNIIYELLSGNVSLAETFNKSKYALHYDSNYVNKNPNSATDNVVDDATDINKLFPDDSFYMTDILPNRVDIEPLKRFVKEQIVKEQITK